MRNKKKIVEYHYQIDEKSKNELADLIIKKIESKERREKEKSALRANYIGIIKGILFLFLIADVMIFIVGLYATFKIGIRYIEIIFLSIALAIMIGVGFKRLDELNKSDAYNMMMFLLTMISLIMTIYTTSKQS